jgi:hypothetical protein
MDDLLTRADADPQGWHREGRIPPIDGKTQQSLGRRSTSSKLD